MKYYPYTPLLYPHLSSNLRFALILLAALLGTAILAGLDGRPEPMEMATEKPEILKPNLGDGGAS